MPKIPQGRPRSDQRWCIFVRNHASATVACDFCVVVTATFRLLYVFVVIEHQARQIVHCNVTAHPAAVWNLQQPREAIPSDHHYRFLIHDRDGNFSPQPDQSISRLEIRVLKHPHEAREPRAFVKMPSEHFAENVLTTYPVNRNPSTMYYNELDNSLQQRSTSFQHWSRHICLATRPPRRTTNTSTSHSKALPALGAYIMNMAYYRMLHEYSLTTGHLVLYHLMQRMPARAGGRLSVAEDPACYALAATAGR